MKTFLIILLALIIGGGGGYFVYSKYFKNQAGSSISPSRTVTAEDYKEPFQWGVNVNPSPVRNYSLEMWIKQMKYVTDLGSGWIRLVYDAKVSNRLEIYDEMVNDANKRSIQVLLSLDSTEPVQTISNPYDDGYKVASEVAEHYKGKIKYYQILNEIGGTVVKGPEFGGEEESDIDNQKYTQVKEWSKGAITAIRKIDPNAYIVIDSFWTHYKAVEMLIRDGIEFDILGWNWYSDMKMMGDKKLEDGSLLTEKLKSFEKPIILAEVNGAPVNGRVNEENQAKFIKEMADWAYNSGIINGFYVHELVDIAPTATRKEGFFGLIKYKKSSDGGYTYGDPKKAYEIYKELITKYTQ